MKPAPASRDLVLVGGGHTHIEVIRRWAAAPIPGVRMSVVLDRPIAVYSGMVPGFVAGQYAASDLEIDVWALARRAGVRVIGAAAVGLDTGRGTVHLEGRPPLSYDVVSFDVGSTVAGADVPGVAGRALPTRPIARFVSRVEAAALERGARVLVVGGGAGGVELAFTLRRRIGGDTTLVDAGERVLAGYPESLARRVAAAAAKRGVTLRTGARVVSVEDGRAVLASGDTLPFDVLAWVTGAAPLPLLAACGLPTDPDGFLRVGPTLQVEGHPTVFAVGDCAALDPPVAKAGVYAVREGPVLDANLRAFFTGAPMRAYRPQKDFLTLLNLGDGTALGAKWGLSFEGAWVWRLKDRIDRRFMEMYGPMDGAPMDTDMVCGGCAAKVGQSELSRALSRLEPRADPSVEIGLAHPDDAAVVVTPGGERIGLTIDAFTAFLDDPWTVGRVAATNAVNDLYAKGMQPRWAMAIVGIPAGDHAEETLFQVMSGARHTLDALGVTLVGGHTIRTTELQVGFSVHGVATGPLRVLGGLRHGDQLVLTRALGSGVLLRADAMGRADGRWVETALRGMARSHRDASGVAGRFGAAAATDVTGFGLAGHLCEMLRPAGLSAALSLSRIPLLPGVEGLLRGGLRSTFHAQNARVQRDVEAPADTLAEVLYDPQTAGGLLFGVADGEGAVAALHEAGESDAAVIGRVEARGTVLLRVTP